MHNTVSLCTLRQDPDAILDAIQQGGSGVLIEAEGQPVAALIQVDLFFRLCRMQERFDSLCARVAASYADTRQGEGLAEINAAVAVERTRS